MMFFHLVLDAHFAPVKCNSTILQAIILLPIRGRNNFKRLDKMTRIRFFTSKNNWYLGNLWIGKIIKVLILSLLEFVSQSLTKISKKKLFKDSDSCVTYFEYFFKFFVILSFFFYWPLYSAMILYILSINFHKISIFKKNISNCTSAIIPTWKLFF